MKEKFYMSLAAFAMLFVAYGCSEDAPANEQQETPSSYSTKSVKQDEPVEVTDFRKKSKRLLVPDNN